MTTPRDTESSSARRRPLEDPPTTQTPAPEQPSSERSGQRPAAEEQPTTAIPRAGASRSPADSGPEWAQGTAARPRQDNPARATVLPGAGASPRPAARPAARPEGRSVPAARPAARTRRARLSLRRIDPWSVFLFSLVASVFLGVALVVAVAVLYSVLGSLGVTDSVNQLVAEVTGGSPTEDALLTSGRIVGGAAVLAAVNVVFLTLLATLGSLLYNLCSSFTGGLELTFGERD